MPSRIGEIVFSEPSGRPHAIVMFASAAFFLVFYAVAADAAGSWLLVMAGGNALSGIAESLPADRLRLAGAFRIAAISLFLALLTALVFVPGFVG